MQKAMKGSAMTATRPAFDVDAFRAVSPVPDPVAAAPDLEFVAEPDEIAGLAWRLVEVDILDMYRLDEIDDRLSLSGETELLAARRWATVRSWMAAAGGPEAALKACPVLAIHMGDKMVPLDGWHRCVVAWLDYGQRTVAALVGIEPAADPDFTGPEV